MAEQLEARDRADMNWLWDLAPRDVPRLERCVAAYERRYPRSNRSYEFRGRLKKLLRRRRCALGHARSGRRASGAGRPGRLGSARLLSDRIVRASRRSSAAPAVARRWSELLERHPSLPTFWPALARQARLKKAEWQVKAAGVQVANGTAPADLTTRLGQLKDQTPQLAPAIRKVEAAQEQVRHDERWKAVQAEALSLAAIDDPATPLAAIDAFLRAYPDTPRRAEALSLARSLKNELATRQAAAERRIVDDLIQSESLPNVSLSDQIERARQFLTDHPDSSGPHRSRAPARRRISSGSTSGTSSGLATIRGSIRPSSRPASNATKTT